MSEQGGPHYGKQGSLIWEDGGLLSGTGFPLREKRVPITGGRKSPTRGGGGPHYKGRFLVLERGGIHEEGAAAGRSPERKEDGFPVQEEGGP